VELDDATDVGGVAVAEVVEDLVVDRLELPPIASICSSLRRWIGFWIPVVGALIVALSVWMGKLGRS